MKKILWIMVLSITSLFSHSPTICEPEKTEKELITELLERIKDLTNAIDSQNKNDTLTILGLLNERGVSYLFIGEFEHALKDFNYILASLQFEQTAEREIFGAALWGRMLCHAFKGLIQETYDDALMIEFFFIGCADCKLQEKKASFFPTVNSNSEFMVIPVAKFANPDEKISVGECKSRVSSTANVMRTIALKIPNSNAKWLVEYIIDQLAEATSYCCDDSPDWTKCLAPIIDAWHNLKESWDKLSSMLEKGVEIAPYLVGPSR